MEVVYKKSFVTLFREMLWEHDIKDMTRKIDHVLLTKDEANEMVDTMSHLVFRDNSWSRSDVTRSGKGHLYGIQVRWEPFE